jgi:F420H(2)-dependent quinone reductase
MPGGSERTPRLPPRWFVRLAWKVHRALFRVTGGRRGLWPPRTQRWGAMRLTTVGRRSGQERSVILGYLDDGPNLATLAMNGWGEGEPAWWLNLQAHPLASVQLKDGTRQVVAHAATGQDRSEPSCGTGGGRWTRISTATPVADRHRRPWWFSNREPNPPEFIRRHGTRRVGRWSTRSPATRSRSRT